MLFHLLLALSRSQEDDAPPANVTDANVSAVTPNYVVDFTNTILYIVNQSETEQLTVAAGGAKTRTKVMTYVVEYVPTLYKILKVFQATPAPTPFQAIPQATRALRIVIFKPGIMIGCTFAAVFVVGFFYTELCRKPKHVHAPPPKKVSKDSSSSSSSLSSMSSAKKKKGGKTKAKSGKAVSMRPGVKGKQTKSAAGVRGGKQPAKSARPAQKSARPAQRSARPAQRSARPAQGNRSASRV